MTDIKVDNSGSDVELSVGSGEVHFSNADGAIKFEICRNDVSFSDNNRPIVFVGGGGSSGGTSYHPNLTGRELADQHPVEAITGLRDELDNMVPGGHSHYYADVIDFQTGVNANSNVLENIAKRHDRLHDWSSSEDHANIPSEFPPSAHQHSHSELSGVGEDSHHSKVHSHVSTLEGGRLNHQYLDDRSGIDVHPHSSLSGVDPDDHHSEAHVHDGSDGSGLMSHTDLLDRTFADQHPHTSIYNTNTPGCHPATAISFDDTDTGFVANNVQDAIFEARKSGLGESFPTGLIDGGELNIVGLDVEVVGGFGVIVDSYTDPNKIPTKLFVDWATLQAPIILDPASTGDRVYFLIVSTGTQGLNPNAFAGAIQQFSSKPTPAHVRDGVYLGYAKLSVWRKF